MEGIMLYNADHGNAKVYRIGFHARKIGTKGVFWLLESEDCGVIYAQLCERGARLWDSAGK
eukprot:1162048-Pelagomonas_calceolata.AAC.2